MLYYIGVKKLCFCDQWRHRPLHEWLDTVRGAFDTFDIREMNPLQMAYIGDTLHDLYVRCLLLSRRTSVGTMHKQAVRMVSASAQAAMLKAISADLTQEEAEIARRGRNAQAHHAAPRHAKSADYAHATGLEALWGYLFLTGQGERLESLIMTALSRTEELWHEQS